MSDDLQERIDDRRAHRCQPPEPTRIGRRFTCACGTTYQVTASPIGGRQWRPEPRIAR